MTLSAVPVPVIPVIPTFRALPVIPAPVPVDSILAKSPVKPVDEVFTLRPVPLVRELVVRASPVPVAVVEEAEMPAVPLFRTTEVAPVVFPSVTVLAFAPVPMFIAPVEPESMETAPVVPEEIVRLLPVAELRVMVPVEVRVVVPLPVKVAAAESTVKRVLLLVSSTKVLRSLVPRVAVVPKLLPP